MTGTTRRRLAAAGLAASAAPILPPRPARAADRAYPDRPVRLVVPYSAGGVADTVARMLQPGCGEHLGQPLVVENRTGASGAVGAASVAQSPPDGHSLLFEGATFATLPIVARSLPLDYDTALVPVAQATSQPYIIGLRPGFPAADLAGFLTEARRRPGELTFGTPGVAHIGHFMGELLQMTAGVKLEHVPFRGGADAARELAAGRIDAAIISYSSLLPAVERGARLVASTGARRQPALPDIPAVAETLPGYELASWIGVFAPAATPPAVQGRFADALRRALDEPRTVERLVSNGTDPAFSDPDSFRERIRRDREVARRIVAATGLRTG